MTPVRRGDVNPFDATSDGERHAMWKRLVRIDGEAFLAGDWARIEDNFDRAHFEGVRCGKSTDPSDWHIVFPNLDAYRDSWLLASKSFLARRFADGVTHRDALFARTHLGQIEITGDRALCLKKFHGRIALDDAEVLDETGQSLFRLHRRADSPWGWRIVGFFGQLPLTICAA